MASYRRRVSMPGQLLYRDGTAAAPVDYERFAAFVEKEAQGTEWRSAWLAGLWRWRLQQQPVVLLKVNLGTTLKILQRQAVMVVVPEGLEEQELESLEWLSACDAPLQVVGHELMNIRERQLLVDQFRGVFNAYRCK